MSTSTTSRTLAIAGATAGVVGLAAAAVSFASLRNVRRAQAATEAKAADAAAKAASHAVAALEAKLLAEAKASIELKATTAEAFAAAAAHATVGPTAAQSARNGRVVALASAFPKYCYTQTQYLEAFIRNNAMLKADEEFARRVWAGTKIETCYSYLEEKDLFRKMSRTEYVTYIKASLKDLAVRSSTDALRQWGGDSRTITHVVFGTMTGSIHAPTMDVEVAYELERLGLPLQKNIKRLNIEGMGCMTGYRCLGHAQDIAKSDPAAVVLVMVCDIRSALGNQLSPLTAGAPVDKSNVIVSSLFRDSGASCIVTAAPVASPKAPLYEIVDHRAVLLGAASFPLVKYAERDDSVIHLYISPDLPGEIKKVLKPEVEALLRPYNLALSDCTYSVHTGGPKVLNYVKESLGISDERMAASWHCMKKYGNLSGSSNLVVLDHWRKLPAGEAKEMKQYTVCMSFGPGVGMELVLLKSVAVPFDA